MLYFSGVNKAITVGLTQQIESCIGDFTPVTLKQLDAVQLQNRIDTKYVLTKAELLQLLQGIQHEQMVLEINDTRIFSYQTVYFDTEDYQFYRDHHNGCINRVKVRSREYVESHLYFYEIKRKLFGTRTDKQRIKVDKLFYAVPPEEYNLIEYKRLHDKPIEQKLINKFNRITLTNKKFTERITIDLNIEFFVGEKHISLPNLSVIEVKQGKSDVFSNTIQVLKKLRIHETPFSKYAVGISLLEDNVKHNNFKPILLKLNKINAYAEC